MFVAKINRDNILKSISIEKVKITLKDLKTGIKQGFDENFLTRRTFYLLMQDTFSFISI